MIWLNKNYTDWKGIGPVHIHRLPIVIDDSVPKDQSDGNENIVLHQPTKSKLSQEIRGLQIKDATILQGRTRQQQQLAQANTTLQNQGDGEGDEEHNDEYGECVMINHLMGITSPMYSNSDPYSVQDALSRPDGKQWWLAMCKEFESLEKRHVGDIVKRNEVPKNRRLIGNRWVFKLKDDGTYRAQTVAKGFSQIPGVDFTENFAPVVNDVTFRIALSSKILFGLNAEQYDIETAFLEVELDEKIHMELPKGYARCLKEQHEILINELDYCMKLRMAIYGLVQAA
jgi:hypothetical protein